MLTQCTVIVVTAVYSIRVIDVSVSNILLHKTMASVHFKGCVFSLYINGIKVHIALDRETLLSADI